MRSDSIVLYAKLETTYGTDATPAVTDAFLVDRPSFEVIGKNLSRKAVSPNYGQMAGVNVGEGLKISFNMDLQMSGTAGAAPRLGRLLRACNMTETVTAGVRVEYLTNNSQTGESLTLWFHLDGQKFVINGAVGTFKLNCKSNELPVLSFEFTGIYKSDFYSTATLPTPTASTELGPFVFRGSDTELGLFTTMVFESFEVDLGNEIAKRMNANASSGVERYFIKDRATKGSVDPEVVALATYNPWANWDSTAATGLYCTIGAAGGRKCVVNIANAVLDIPKLGDRESIATYAIPFRANASAHTQLYSDLKFIFS